MASNEFFSTREVDGVQVVVFQQAQILDAVAIERMTAALKDFIDQAKTDRFLFDFSHVTYLSSSALGMLVSLQRRVAQQGGQLRLAGIHDDIMEVFQITKLDTVFDIYNNRNAALEAWNA